MLGRLVKGRERVLKGGVQKGKKEHMVSIQSILLRASCGGFPLRSRI